MFGRCLALGMLGLVAGFGGCTTQASGEQAQSGFQQGQTGAPSAPSNPGQPATPSNAGDAGCPTNQPCQPQPGQVAPLGSVSSDQNALTNIIAGALAGAAASMGALSGGELKVLEEGIKMKARTDAKNMRPEGQLMHAKLQSDRHAAGSLVLEPNRCYSIVGFAGPGVFAYQINVMTAPPLPPQVLAQSKADGIDPTVGPNETCVKSGYPMPMPVKIDMHVLKGQGLVGAQVYRK